MHGGKILIIELIWPKNTIKNLESNMENNMEAYKGGLAQYDRNTF